MRKNSFLTGSIFAVVSLLIIKALGILYVIPFYSIVGASGATLYSYAYNVYAIFLNISSAGLPIGISKLISEFKAKDNPEAINKTIRISTVFVLIISFISFFVLMLFAEPISKLIIGDKVGGNSINDISLVVRVVSLSLIVIPFLSVIRGYLQGHKFIKESSNSQIIEQIVRIVVILLGSYICINILNLSIPIAVSISLIGALIGGIVSIIYLALKIVKNKDVINDNKKHTNIEHIDNRIIFKKIILYSLPFIIISVTANIFNLVDMTFIIRILGNLGYSGEQAEFVASVITTWGDKFNAVINAIASGIIISLIPHVVSAYTKKDNTEVNSIINKSLQMVMYVSIPLCLFISTLATPFWDLFYGENILGSSVLKISVLTSMFCNIYLIFIQASQSLNKYKIVYLSVFLGFLANAFLDIPLMYFCNYLGIAAYYGASFATICGYLISCFIVYRDLIKMDKINFRNTFINLIKIIISSLVVIILVELLKSIFKYNYSSFLSNLLYIFGFSLVSILVYLFITVKMHIFENIFGKSLISNIKNRKSLLIHNKFNGSKNLK